MNQSFFLETQKKWERLLLEPVDSNLKPGRQRFLEELRKVLYPGSKSYEGFRGWAKKSLPIDEHTGERFPLGHANLTFFKVYEQKIDELEELFGKEENPNIEQIYQSLGKFFARNKKEIEANFVELEVFGYPVVLITNEDYWPKSNPDARALQYDEGYILLKVCGEIEIGDLVESLIHELTHALSRYPNRNMYNLRPIEKRLFKQRTNRLYNLEDLFNETTKQEIREIHKKRILDIFMQEVETYFCEDKIDSLEESPQEWFNHAFAMVINEETPEGKFELLESDVRFKPHTNTISLVEIQKYDPEFGDELDRTLKFWKMAWNVLRLRKSKR
jgi:hypothetical protein